MTDTIDKFLVGHGFECQELNGIKHRTLLYLAIIITSLSAIAVSGLALAAWT